MESADDVALGWDVGAWNCDRNQKSRDVLCALSVDGGRPTMLGRPWRGNLRDLLVTKHGNELTKALLARVGVQARRSTVLAIDTPLAWPRRMIELVTRGTTVDVPEGADCNPYLFREQELTLFAPACRPLSTVRDMIGSQSTKGLHFLSRAGLRPDGVGVWRDSSCVAIETYPAPAACDAEVGGLTSDLLAAVLAREGRPRGAAWREDVEDAITCALIARLFRLDRSRLRAPPANARTDEGWIWLP